MCVALSLLIYISKIKNHHVLMLLIHVEEIIFLIKMLNSRQRRQERVEGKGVTQKRGNFFGGFVAGLLKNVNLYQFHLFVSFNFPSWLDIRQVKMGPTKNQ